MGKLIVVAKTREAIAAIADESNSVRRRPHWGESENEPPKILPSTPEIEALPKAKPTDVEEKPRWLTKKMGA